MFDRYAAQTAPSWGRRALFLASIVIHVSAGIALAIYSIIHVEEIAPPAINLTFFSAPPPPPPPPPKKHHHSETKTEVKKPDIVKPITPTTIVQPVDKKPEKQETKDEPDEPGATDDGVEGGVPGGVKGGVVGGTVGGTGNGPPAKGKIVPMFTLMASALSHPDPHLPDQYKAAHQGQSVKANYEICIGQDGSITSVDAIVAIGGVDSDLMQQIKSSWKYKPQPLPVCFRKPFIFNIR